MPPKTETAPATGNFSLPPWAATFIGGVIISAVTSWGTFQYAAGKQQAQIDANTAYIAADKARKDKEVEALLQKKQDYAERMEALLQQYLNAAPNPPARKNP